MTAFRYSPILFGCDGPHGRSRKLSRRARQEFNSTDEHAGTQPRTTSKQHATNN